MAREVILALPHELSEEARISLTRDMALFLVSKYGVAVDAATHAPQEAMGDDPRNHHAHLLFTTRVVKQDGLGEKTRILDDKERGPQQIELIRQVWETLANAALQQAGFLDTQIDHRTLEDQGIDRIPQEHVGKVGTHENIEAEDAAEDPAEEIETEEDEDDSGETETKGKASSGDKVLMPSTVRKNKSPSKKAKRAFVPRVARMRVRMNEDIKRLNARRAEFSLTPLEVQIRELDRHIDRMDSRADMLGTLSKKTSLPEALLLLILTLLTATIAIFAVRTKDEAARTFRAVERDTKAERQRAQYGRTYRAPLYERMEDMREKIHILETRQKQVQKYQTLLNLIERRVDAIRPMLKIPSLPTRTEWKVLAIPVVHQPKAVLEAIQVRQRVPLEYRPTIKQESAAKNFTIELVSSVSHAVLNHATKPAIEAAQGGDTKQLEKTFTLAVLPVTDKTDREIWHKEVTIKIKSLGHLRVKHMSIFSDYHMNSPKVWNIEVNEKGKIILERIQADIRERKAEMPRVNSNGFSIRFNNPSKNETDVEVIQRVRTEADAARTKVPPNVRAESYSEEKPKDSMPELGFSSAFKNAEQSTPEDKYAKMSSEFNSLAKAKAANVIPNSTRPEISAQ